MKHPLLPASLLLVVVILICEGLFGLFSMWSDPMRSAQHYSHSLNDSNWLLVKVSESPTKGRNSNHAVSEVLQVLDSNGATIHCRGKILLYISPDVSVAYSDTLLLLASPSRPSPATNPHQFDYRRHLARKGITHTAYISNENIMVVGNGSHGFRSAIHKLRTRLINAIHYSDLSSSQQGIAEALILGWDDDLSPETRSDFQRAGITHLLCVSGLHVGIVAMIVGYCLFFLGRRRWQRILRGCLQLLVLWFFVMLTGMAPGTMRAGLMFSLIVVGQMFLERPSTINSIAASAVILLVSNPMLLFDVGFQLSYSAVTGIVLFVRPLEQFLPLPSPDNKVGKMAVWLVAKARTMLCVSFVAQMCTLPFTLLYFHQFPVYFLVANMVVIPFAGILLGSVIVMLAFSWLPWAFSVLSKLVGAELSATQWVTSTVSSWPNAMLSNLYFDGFMFVLAVAIIVAMGWFLLRKKTICLASALLLASILVLHTRIVEARCASQRVFDIYNIGNRTAIEFFHGHDSYLVCDSITARHPYRIDFQTSGNLVFHKTSNRHILPLDTTLYNDAIYVKDNFIGFDSISFFVVDRGNYRHPSIIKPSVNYLLLRESPYITVSELAQRFDFDTLVIVSQNSRRRQAAWSAECDSMNMVYIKSGE
ncbi:MAG: ComEC family competence protein [Bacteroidales bacterium]|nr:ComEC family competence protein [Bacteroidales bacterium]